MSVECTGKHPLHHLEMDMLDRLISRKSSSGDKIWSWNTQGTRAERCSPKSIFHWNVFGWFYLKNSQLNGIRSQFSSHWESCIPQEVTTERRQSQRWNPLCCTGKQGFCHTQNLGGLHRTRASFHQPRVTLHVDSTQSELAWCFPGSFHINIVQHDLKNSNKAINFTYSTKISRKWCRFMTLVSKMTSLTFIIF